MKTLSAEALTAIAGRDLVRAAAIRFNFGTTYRIWSGVGNLVFNSETFVGIDAPALVSPISSSRGGGADGVTLSLSGLDPDVAATIEAEDYQQKPVTIWRCEFANGRAADTGSFLGAAVYLRGRCESVLVSETLGGDATITMQIEGGRRDMSRAGGRMRSDTDQRLLGGSTDGSMRHVSAQETRVLYWGQIPRQIATVNAGATGSYTLPGITFGSGGAARWD